MKNTIMLVPIGNKIGLTSISIGFIYALEQRGIEVNFFKPICSDDQDKSISIMDKYTTLNLPKSLSLSYADELIRKNQVDNLLEEIVSNYYHNNMQEGKMMIVEGLPVLSSLPFVSTLNAKIAKALNAKIIFVFEPEFNDVKKIQQQLAISISNFGIPKKQILGAILNKGGISSEWYKNKGSQKYIDIFSVKERYKTDIEDDMHELYQKSVINILGVIPFNVNLLFPRVVDLVSHLNCEVLYQGELSSRRIKKITFASHSIKNMIQSIQPDCLIVTSADREDAILGIALAIMNGVKVGALLLTGGYVFSDSVEQICKKAFSAGVPILLTKKNTWETSQNLQSFNSEVSVDDADRIRQLQEYVAENIEPTFIESLKDNNSSQERLTPSAFRYHLTDKARKNKKVIVLPEGEEIRTIKAAFICAEKKIAQCILLGNPYVIEDIVRAEGIALSSLVSIIEPEDIREQYIAPLVQLRKHKGVTELVAAEQLRDNVVLATMMLQQGDVDGLVAGALNTTANTIRPALQLIKTAPNYSLVSSLFFMLLPDDVLVYADCAINPDPDYEQLAEIAIQSADSAISFGIQPKIGMISYSTGTSGIGADVDKVKKATALVKKLRPDLDIDGPLQYDAAVIPSVAATKAPKSTVAGKANVLVFPDLNTGNTTYKAVQRSANLVSIGPMLQGLNKPVNDLSRGALVDDIVYTIALTAIQAKST